MKRFSGLGPDERLEILQRVHGGMSISKASRQSNVCRDSVNTWLVIEYGGSKELRNWPWDMVVKDLKSDPNRKETRRCIHCRQSFDGHRNERMCYSCRTTANNRDRMYL